MRLRDAAFNLVQDYPGGAESLAPRFGKNATTLSHEVKGTGTAKLGLEDSERMTIMSGDLRILASFAHNCGQMLVPLPEALEHAGDDCMMRLADTAREFAELCREVSADLADGTISDNELARINKEVGRMNGCLHALQKAVAVRNLEGKPAHAGGVV